jgi:protocatechuate 4,5-dioxygenase beta chain
MFVPADKWDIRYKHSTGTVPQPREAALETEDVIRGYADRIDKGFAELNRQLSAYQPDVVVMVSDDQGEVFDKDTCMPSLALCGAAELWGTLGLDWIGPEGTRRVDLRGHSELAAYLANRLVQAGFDLTYLPSFKPMGRPGRGLSHGFVRPAPKLLPNLDIPVVPVLLNCYYPPLPTAQRCYELGRALRALLDERPERIAIYGSGGLSHDPGGPRAGWIDERLDHFVLDALRSGKPEQLLGLYTVDSDTMRGGTGEIRNWIVVAGAMAERKAEVVDYIPAHHAVTGLGFAYWTESA